MSRAENLPSGQTVTHKVQVPAGEAAARIQIEAAGGKLIADYGSFRLYETTLSPGFTANSLIEFRDEFNYLNLNARRIDTGKAEVQQLRQRVGNFSGKRLHLVQFAGPVLPSWREDVLATGVQIVTYLPENSYLVYGDYESISRLQNVAAENPHFQWDGPYLDEFKLDPQLTGPRAALTTNFAVQLLVDSEANPTTLAFIEQLKLAAIPRQTRCLDYLNLVVSVRATDLSTIAARPDVISIQPYFDPKKLCERQAQIVAGNVSAGSLTGPGYLAWLAEKGFSQAQFLASNFSIDLADSGVDNGTPLPNHPGLHIAGAASNGARVIYNRLEGTAHAGSTLKGCDGHGTLNAHIIGGFDDGSGFPHADAEGYHYGLGICPFISVGSSVIFDPDYYTHPNFASLASRAYNSGARISNNSWGQNNGGRYNIDAQEYDALVRDAQPSGSAFPVAGNQEMVMVFAAGNDGPDPASLSAPGSAKNVITVGMAENVQLLNGPDGCGHPDAEADNANDLNVFSSHGPCADGRAKPDLVAPGSHVSGGVAQSISPAATGTMDSCFTGSSICGVVASPFFPSAQQLFTVSSGSSHAAAAVAGGCALIRQYFINNFGAAPSPAITKAFLINSARRLTGSGANDDLWSNGQGMGEMNLGSAFDGVSRVVRDQVGADRFTASGQSRTFSGPIGDPGKPFLVTLAWTDAPGATSGNAYKNNLDLTVTVGGVTYKGNVFAGGLSVSGGSADLRNNVESVFLPAGAGANYTVTVTAVNINSDGVPGNSSPLDQDFALVINNTVGTPPTIASIQPTNTTVLGGDPLTLTAMVTGSAPLVYQWQHESTNLPNANQSTYSLPAAGPQDSGLYRLVVTNLFGRATSAVVSVSVIPTVPLDYALNNSNLTWTTDANARWYGQTNVSDDGIAAGQSGAVSDGQQTSLRTTVFGPGTLRFAWKVSSDPGDVLSFRSGSTTLASISGETTWAQQQFYLPSGSLALEWRYAKNGSGSAGQDHGWVDEVTYTSGGTAPYIVTQPVGQGSFGGSAALFTVKVDGTATLTYQWRLNGTNISGATRTSLSIPNPATTNSGLYTVRVANSYGSIISSNAALAVVPLAMAGDNTLGQFNVSPLASNAVAVSAGDYHTLALRKDGTVAAWGNNSHGQCTVPAVTRVVAIAAGGYHSLALQANGLVTAWGANYSGQASPPAGLSRVVAIAAGQWHSLALRADGTVIAWGDNSLGQTDVPVDLASVVAIAAGGSHSLALKADGTVAAWGDNTDASGLYVGQSTVPSGLGSVAGIAAGAYHSLALLANGTVFAWGDNSESQLQIPVGLSNVVAIAAGAGHNLALKRDGRVVGWGNNGAGQINLAPGLTNVIAVSAGALHSIALLGSLPDIPEPLYPLLDGDRFTVVVQTAFGKNYDLEFKDSLTASVWTTAASISGNGSMRFLADSDANVPCRFYRVRQW